MPHWWRCGWFQSQLSLLFSLCNFQASKAGLKHVCSGPSHTEPLGQVQVPCRSPFLLAVRLILLLLYLVTAKPVPCVILVSDLTLGCCCKRRYPRPHFRDRSALWTEIRWHQPFLGNRTAKTEFLVILCRNNQVTTSFWTV